MRRRAISPVLVGSVLVASLLVAACGGGGTADGATPAGPGSEDRTACRGPRTADTTPDVEPLADEGDPELPVTVTDATGGTVTIESADRILALDTYGTLGTTVYALGLGDRLVGRDISTGVESLADLPLVTRNGHELNGEAILELDPDVVLTDDSIGPIEVQYQLQASGIPVVFLDGQRSAARIAPQIRAVAEALGVPERGQRLVERVEEEVAEAQADVDRWRQDVGGDAQRMVFLYLRGNAGVYYWFGEGSGADDLIEDLGGVDVASESGLSGSKPVNAEGLVSTEPDLYLMMTDGLESVGGVEGLLEVPGVADTQAGQNGCVVDMADTRILSFGPQYADTLRALGAAIYAADEEAGGEVGDSGAGGEATAR